MRTAFAAAFVFTALLAPAASAAAEPCMCATSETAMTPSYEAMAYDAMAYEAMGYDAMGYDARTAPSAALDGSPAPSPAEDRVLWCSDDDPRCVPAAPHPSDPPPSLSSSVLGMGARAASAPDPDAAGSLPGWERGNPCPGFRWRIDRPPRG